MNSTLNKTGDGYDITSTFGGVTISGGAKDGGKPAGAGWNSGPVGLLELPVDQPGPYSPG